LPSVNSGNFASWETANSRRQGDRLRSDGLDIHLPCTRYLRSFSLCEGLAANVLRSLGDSPDNMEMA
jgi:hypothetical protein